MEPGRVLNDCSISGQSQVQLQIYLSPRKVVPVMLACSVWGKQCWGQIVRAYCDNEVAVAVLNLGYSQDQQIMHLLQCLFFIKAHFQIPYSRKVWREESLVNLANERCFAKLKSAKSFHPVQFYIFS